ncbi:hypothetical protein HPB51_024226 [Rhipicephalus microplus]|uniref:HTH psq-type domain-containing protein n=1 Tax=Rhipicephalus microplus TaxID=6941 RepID=A0A9J6DWZ1_RHIMP|nr:hypothetical protein HPB51_024226 [Rhipicephalus microplus]
MASGQRTPFKNESRRNKRRHYTISGSHPFLEQHSPPKMVGGCFLVKLKLDACHPFSKAKIQAHQTFDVTRATSLRAPKPRRVVYFVGYMRIRMGLEMAAVHLAVYLAVYAHFDVMACRKRKQILLNDKLKMVNAAARGEKQVDIAKTMGLSKLTVSSSLKSKSIAGKQVSGEINPNRFRLRETT